MALSRSEGENFPFTDSDRDLFARLAPSPKPGLALRRHPGRSTVPARPALRHTAEDEAQFARLTPGRASVPARSSRPAPASSDPPGDTRDAALREIRRERRATVETASGPPPAAPVRREDRSGSDRFSKPLKIRRPGRGVIKLRYFD